MKKPLAPFVLAIVWVSSATSYAQQDADESTAVILKYQAYVRSHSLQLAQFESKLSQHLIQRRSAGPDTAPDLWLRSLWDSNGNELKALLAQNLKAPLASFGKGKMSGGKLFAECIRLADRHFWDEELKTIARKRVEWAILDKSTFDGPLVTLIILRGNREGYLEPMGVPDIEWIVSFDRHFEGLLAKTPPAHELVVRVLGTRRDINGQMELMVGPGDEYAPRLKKAIRDYYIKANSSDRASVMRLFKNRRFDPSISEGG